MMLFHLIDVDNKTDLKSPQRWHIYDSLKMTGRVFFFLFFFQILNLVSLLKNFFMF